MFTHILVPVDLSEKQMIAKAVRVAVDQARHYEAKLTLVSVVGGLQAKVSNSSGEYARQLAEYADEITIANGIIPETMIYEVPDPSVEVDRKLLQVISDTGADLVIMATHQPGWVEYIVNSHGGRLASHAPVSVFVVRD
jgi:nucleotide-binding universal stress UspA family protein